MIELMEFHHEHSLKALEDVVKKTEVDQIRSEKEIRENLVSVCMVNEIEYSAGDIFSANCSQGTGLKITSGGFILTAYHNIKNRIEEWGEIIENNQPTMETAKEWLNTMQDKYFIMDKDKKRIPIDPTFFAYDLDNDIALIKAYTGYMSHAAHIKFADSFPKVGEEIKLFGLLEGVQFNQFGNVIKRGYSTTAKNPSNLGGGETKIQNAIQTDAYSTPGFSGGIYTNNEGVIVGMNLFSSDSKGGNLGYAGGTGAPCLKSLLNEAIEKLKEGTYPKVNFKDRP